MISTGRCNTYSLLSYIYQLLVYKGNIKLKLLPSILLLVSPLTQSATIPERFYAIDEEFYQVVIKTNACVLSMNNNNKKPESLDQCKSALSIDRKEIKKLQSKFNKQTDRYKERKHKLTEHSQYWVEKYMLKIKERVKVLQKNIHTIYGK